MISAREALEKLRSGNDRFVCNRPENLGHVNYTKLAEVVTGQHPFAVILGCADSRVPIEIVFDQTIGDLFVIRVAGNIAGPTAIGSVEYAVLHLGTPLVVVLGHSQCGAVRATIEALRASDPDLTEGLEAVVDYIRPAVIDLITTHPDAAGDTIVDEAVRANVRASVRTLKEASPAISELTETEGLRIVGAEYSLLTGVVEFFDGVPID